MKRPWIIIKIYNCTIYVYYVPDLLQKVSNISLGDIFDSMTNSLPQLSRGNSILPIPEIPIYMPKSYQGLSTLNVDNHVWNAIEHAINQSVLILDPFTTFLVNYSHILQQSEHLLVPPLVLFIVSLINRSPRFLDSLIDYSNRMGNVLSKFLASVKRTLTLNYTRPTRPTVLRVFGLRQTPVTRYWVPDLEEVVNTAYANMARALEGINEGLPAVTLEPLNVQSIIADFERAGLVLNTNFVSDLTWAVHIVNILRPRFLDLNHWTDEDADLNLDTTERAYSELMNIHYRLSQHLDQLIKDLEDGNIGPDGKRRH